jgi:hypothetical protein
MRESQTYRKDIDGLRAIAIIPVLLYHLNFRYTPGGFIGVDIFFVISGFLITQHIAAELEAGRFSLTAFYERRIRRIFPALVAMLLCATVFAYLLLLPLEMVEFSRSLLAAVLSVSNIYFWLNTDYFQIKDIPLLHTWSLGVEEQFPGSFLQGTYSHGYMPDRRGVVCSERSDCIQVSGSRLLPASAKVMGVAAWQHPGVADLAGSFGTRPQGDLRCSWPRCNHLSDAALFQVLDFSGASGAAALRRRGLDH